MSTLVVDDFVIEKQAGVNVLHRAGCGTIGSACAPVTVVHLGYVDERCGCLGDNGFDEATTAATVLRDRLIAEGEARAAAAAESFRTWIKGVCL